MADTIIALLRRKPLVEEMRKNAKEELARITWRVAAEKIRAVYYRTIHREGV
jgi:glycosyltransferase involved in cell wall biosynthesis